MAIQSLDYGYAISGKSIGEAWLSLCDCILKNGNIEADEDRLRLAIHGVKMTVFNHSSNDNLLTKYANMESINKMRKMAFESDTMEDFDITPSFRNGAKSYKKRLEEGNMINFVLKRLTRIPESKKAIMVFPTYEDYENVTNSPYNDYLPCIVSLQFRLHRIQSNEYKLDTHFFMRSQDAFQKNFSDLVIFSDITKIIKDKLMKLNNWKIDLGLIDGYITDAHIYRNTEKEAFQAVSSYLNSQAS